MCYGIIYKTTNLVNGKIYVGQTTRDDENYIGSGSVLLQAVKKYGRKISSVKHYVNVKIKGN